MNVSVCEDNEYIDGDMDLFAAALAKELQE